MTTDQTEAAAAAIRAGLTGRRLGPAEVDQAIAWTHLPYFLDAAGNVNAADVDRYVAGFGSAPSAPSARQQGLAAAERRFGPKAAGSASGRTGLQLAEISTSNNHGLLRAAARFGTPDEQEAANHRIGVLNREERAAAQPSAAEAADTGGTGSDGRAGPDMGQGDRGRSIRGESYKAAALAEAERRFGPRARDGDSTAGRP